MSRPGISFDAWRSLHADEVDASMYNVANVDTHFRGARTMRSTVEVDNMSPALRQCVHEFGSQIVSEIVQAGIKDPTKIRAIVRTCWSGARQVNQRTKGMGASKVAGHLDWILQQGGCGLTAATLLRILWLHGMVILPNHPSVTMVEASVQAHLGAGLMTKAAKHKLRLTHAIEAGAKRLWPFLFDPHL